MSRSFNEALRYLGKAKREQIEITIREAVLIAELGGDAKKYLFKEAKKLKGSMKAILKAVAKLTAEEIDEIWHVMTLQGKALDEYVPKWQREQSVIIEYVD